jgi:hypothetical protein
VIELELDSLEQLGNSFDPVPFHENELNPDVEDYIYNYVDEFSLKKPLEIIIHLSPNEVSTEIKVNLTRAIWNHVFYRNLLTEIELRRILYQGRTNFLIALIFLLSKPLLVFWIINKFSSEASKYNQGRGFHRLSHIS